MPLFLIIKLLIVLIFLVMFLRRPSLPWGIGLLTVTTAVMLDTFLDTFSRSILEEELGFFYFIFGGILFAGAALWLFGVLRPYLGGNQPASTTTVPIAEPSTQTAAALPPLAANPDGAFDQQMIYEQIRTRFGRDDVLDLMFDLGINENDVMTLNQDMNSLVLNIMNLAEQNGQTGALALAVERILTPSPPDHLPRLEKINSDSPPTILRQYLIAHYSMVDLQNMATRLGLDWEEFGVGGKKERVRNMLLYLYRRGRIEELVDILHEETTVADSSQTT